MRDVTLAEARDRAEQLRIEVWDGRDPAVEKKVARAEAKAVVAAATMPSFEECAQEYIASHEVGWKNEKHPAQWRSTLKTYVYPLIGEMPVNEVTIEDVVRVLKPIWTEDRRPPGTITAAGRR